MPRRRIPGRRSREVLVLVLAGHSNEQIAQELGISESTVKTHLEQLRAAGYLTRRQQRKGA